MRADALRIALLKRGLDAVATIIHPLPGDQALIRPQFLAPAETLLAVPAGAVFTGSAPVVTLPTVTIGGAKAQVLFCGVVSAGLYQLTVVVPKVASGDQLLVAKVGSSQTQSTISVPVQ